MPKQIVIENTHRKIDSLPRIKYCDTFLTQLRGFTFRPSLSRNEGLLLAKTGPTPNVAAAVGELKHVKGIVLTELGYDIRKAGPAVSDDRGSHCSAGAPRFNVETTTGFFFVGCNSPAPDTQAPGDGFIRLRWGTGGTVQGFDAATGLLSPITGTVKSITIVFDEGTDTGPDNFGLAVLDNVDVNGTLVGRGNDD